MGVVECIDVSLQLVSLSAACVHKFALYTFMVSSKVLCIHAFFWESCYHDIFLVYLKSPCRHLFVSSLVFFYCLSLYSSLAFDELDPDSHLFHASNLSSHTTAVFLATLALWTLPNG